MSNVTKNLSLLKPESKDDITLDLFANNFLKIDEAFENGGGSGIDIIVEVPSPVIGSTITAECGLEKKEMVATSNTVVFKSTTLGVWTISENKYGVVSIVNALYFGQYYVSLDDKQFSRITIIYPEDFIGATITLSSDSYGDIQSFLADSSLKYTIYTRYVGKYIVRVEHQSVYFEEDFEIEEFGDNTFSIDNEFVNVTIYTNDNLLKDTTVELYYGKEPKVSNKIKDVLLVNGVARTSIIKRILPINKDPEIYENTPSADYPIYISAYSKEYDVWNYAKYENLLENPIIDITSKELYLYDSSRIDDKECSHITGGWKGGGGSWTGAKNTWNTTTIVNKDNNTDDQRNNKSANPYSYLQWVNKILGWHGFSTLNNINISKWNYINVEISENFALYKNVTTKEGETEQVPISPVFYFNVNERNGKAITATVKRTTIKDTLLCITDIDKAKNSDSFSICIFGRSLGTYSINRIWLSKDKPIS